MDLLSVVVVVALAVLVVVLGVLVAPVVRAQWRASRHGMAISLKEAHALATLPDVPDQFMNAAADLRKIDRRVYLGALIDYHLAGGDLPALKEGLEKIKASGKEVSFNTLLLLNLAKKDVQEALDNIDRVYTVSVTGIEEKGVSVDVFCEFTIDFQDAFWVTPDTEAIAEHVRQKVSMALLSADTNDADLAGFIEREYLNKAFWRGEAHAVVQQLNVSVEK
jgi:uncharacterized protein YqfA (UPF0365 family)